MEEKHSSEDVIKLKNKVNLIRSNKAKLNKAIGVLSTINFLDLEMDSEGNLYTEEAYSILQEDYLEGLSSFNDYYSEVEEVILKDLEEPVVTTKHELKVYSQKSGSTFRYYYNSIYLFSAPLELFEELQIEFNSLMNEEPKLALTEVIEKLKVTKEFLPIFRKEEEELPVLRSNNLIEIHEVES